MFACREEGAATLEFALLAGPMIALIVSMMETSLIAIRTSLMENAMSVVAKQIYIGNVNNGALTKENIEDYICQRLGPFTADCDGNLNVELIPVTRIGNIPDDGAACRDAEVEIEPAVRFNTSGSSLPVYLRACLTMDIIVPGLGVGLHLPKTDAGRYQLVAATAFQNEPF